jgi:hypothetical protein
MKRRKFLILSAAGTCSLLIPASLYVSSGSVKYYAILVIKKQLDYLMLEEGSVESFVNDYFEYSKNDIVNRLKWKTMYYLNIGPQKSNLILELVKYYLLSSSFFINRADEHILVKYLGLYSPYKSPLPNPFSFIIYPPE